MIYRRLTSPPPWTKFEASYPLTKDEKLLPPKNGPSLNVNFRTSLINDSEGEVLKSPLCKILNSNPEVGYLVKAMILNLNSDLWFSLFVVSMREWLIQRFVNVLTEMKITMKLTLSMYANRIHINLLTLIYTTYIN